MSVVDGRIEPMKTITIDKAYLERIMVRPLTDEELSKIFDWLPIPLQEFIQDEIDYLLEDR
jgi:hypothetical protein